MRTFILAILLSLASVCASAGDEATDATNLNLVRVPILNGIYTIEAPSEWHLEISGDDLTATFAEEPDADGTLIISAPNPAVKDIKEYMRQAAGSLLESFGNGEIVQDEEKEIDGFRAYTVWFSLRANETDFLGWGRTIDFDGVAVQAMTLSTGGKFNSYMQIAEPIFDSYELDVEMVEENIDLLREIGRKVLKSLNVPAKEETPEPAA